MPRHQPRPLLISPRTSFYPPQQGALRPVSGIWPHWTLSHSRVVWAPGLPGGNVRAGSISISARRPPAEARLLRPAPAPRTNRAAGRKVAAIGEPEHFCAAPFCHIDLLYTMLRFHVRSGLMHLGFVSLRAFDFSYMLRFLDAWCFASNAFV